jgi:23S rRNA (guanosine2251-2'-O)-methyltransferase
MNKDTLCIYGKHALKEALLYKPEVLREVFFVGGGNTNDQLKELARKAEVQTSTIDERAMVKRIGEVTHQGVAGSVFEDKLITSYEDYINKLEVTSNTSILLLGEIQDPQNVGAMIRSAAAFGVSSVLIPTYNQVPITGTVIKVSAGMAFRIPLISIGNVNTVIRDLKERGFWIYGLDGESKKDVTEEVFDKASVFVLGNESTGMREKTREICDFLVSIPIHPRCESLNVAASTAVVLNVWSMQHKEVLK